MDKLSIGTKQLTIEKTDNWTKKEQENRMNVCNTKQGKYYFIRKRHVRKNCESGMLKERNLILIE